MCKRLKSLIGISLMMLTPEVASAQAKSQTQATQPSAPAPEETTASADDDVAESAPPSPAPPTPSSTPEAASGSSQAPASTSGVQEPKDEAAARPASELDPAVAAANAAAERRAQTPSMLSVMGKVGFVYDSGLGASARYRYEVLPEGWLRSGTLRDDLGVELGADYISYEIQPLDWSLSLIEVYASVTWNVWFTEHFAAYPRAGLGFGIASLDTGDSSMSIGSYGGLYGVGGLGMLYDLGTIRLRAELANRDLNLGAAFVF